MREKLSLKNENRGASLLAVLILLVVISAIAVVITKITIVNIQMKEVERGSKKNFYTADEVLDNLHTGAAEKSAEAMKTAYEIVMQNYVKNEHAGKDLQEEFKKQYMKALEDLFWDHSSNLYQKPTGSMAPSTDVTYSTSKYSVDTLKGCIHEDSVKDCLKTKNDDAEYDADYKKGNFILRNVKIVFNGTGQYEDTITTNLVFHTPEMNFTGGNQVQEFMKYSLIADQMIEVKASGVKVGGNVYAGLDGIRTFGNDNDGTFDGKIVLTRGNITANAGTNLTIGNGRTSVWAKNLIANGMPKGVTADTSVNAEAVKDLYTLDINASCYIADDLSLDRSKSRVRISGNYYGYNFQEDYGEKKPAMDAAYNSAIMINGTESKLNIENINYLMLAGRTFISRGKQSGNKDILMGESLSVRTNQLAYYVPADWVNKETKTLNQNGIDGFKKITEIDLVNSGYLANEQVVPYYYNDIVNGLTVNYYLNFKNEQKANDYFAAYCSDESGKIKQYATKYLTEDAIILDSSHLFTLKGDIMYRNDANSSLKGEKITIEDDKWDTSGTYYNSCAGFAMKYKALQLGLTETNAKATKDNVRLRADNQKTNKVDSSVDPLFLSLIDKASMQSDLSGGQKMIDCQPIAGGPYQRAVILVDNAADLDSAYQLEKNVTQGIIVATGNVNVTHNFTGLIICGGKITFADSVQVSADETMVMDMFATDLKKKSREFTQYFQVYKNGGDVANLLNGKIDANTYLTYENWKRNE